MTNNKPILWCDQDGVLAIYEHHAYKGNDPLYLQEHKHYFLNLHPDTKMIEAVHLMQSFFEVHIITNIAATMSTFLQMEHTADKINWLHRYMPFIPTKNIHVTSCTKNDFAEAYMDRPLTSYDFLISDYNKDLTRWKQANGTGFKYCNGLNNPKSWDGNRLLTTYTSKQIAKLIINSYPVANKTI